MSFEEIGWEEIDDGIGNIVFYKTILGRIDRKTGRIIGPDKVETPSPDFR